MKFLRVLRQIMRDIVWWGVYYPLWVSGKIKQIDVFGYDGQLFNVFTVQTFLGKDLYWVQPNSHNQSEDFLGELSRDARTVFHNLEGKSVREFQRAHKALGHYNPSQPELHVQF